MCYVICWCIENDLKVYWKRTCGVPKLHLKICGVWNWTSGIPNWICTEVVYPGVPKCICIELDLPLRSTMFACTMPLRKGDYYVPHVGRGHYKMGCGVRRSLCNVPRPNSWMERPRKTKNECSGSISAFFTLMTIMPMLMHIWLTTAIWHGFEIVSAF